MNTDSQQFIVVIPAAGVGGRFASELPKQYAKVLGKTILEHAIEPFLKHPALYKIVVVLARSDQYWQQVDILKHPKILLSDGANERYESVLQGLVTARDFITNDGWILVHDAARPCLWYADLELLWQNLREHPVGGLLARPLFDTIKTAHDDHVVTATLNRRELFAAQTPQMFRYQILREALEAAIGQRKTVTDEASAIEKFHETPPKLVLTPRWNLKLTVSGDLPIIETLLRERALCE
jgi:2-C-methyl-D-erythritol 4-phosphate cytidylyltransferase